MAIGAAIMKVVVKVRDVVELTKRFEESPAEAMRELVACAQQGFEVALKKVMDAEIALFLGGPDGQDNERSACVARTFAVVKGIGSIARTPAKSRNSRMSK